MIDVQTAPSIAVIRAEFDRINVALANMATSDDQYAQLYAARCAMDWMLNCYVISPFDRVMSGHAGDLIKERRTRIRRIAEGIAGRK